MKLTPTPQQEWDINLFLANRTGGAADLSIPGQGKTCVAVETALRMWAQTVLIIGVRDTFRQWADTVQGQSDGHVTLRRMNNTKAGEQAIVDYLSGVPGFYFIGLQLLSSRDYVREPMFDRNGNPVIDPKTGVQKKKKKRLKTWDNINPDLVILDEGHQASRRFTNGNTTMVNMKAKSKLLLSGTPYGNAFENFHGITSFLWPYRNEVGDIADSSFLRWKQKYCATANQYVAGGRAIQKVTGEKYPGEFIKILPCVARREDEAQMPVPQRIEVDLSPEQRRIYDDLENQLLSWVRGHVWSIDWPVTLTSHLSTVTMAEPTITEDGEIYFADDAQSAKLDAATGLMKTLNVPMFHLSMSRRYVELAVPRLQALGFRVAAYTGQVSSKDRDEVKRAFMAGEIDHVFATWGAASTGLDGFQFRCNTIVMHSKPHGNPTLLEQGLRRIWRPGGDLANFRAYEILARGTKDEGVYSSLELQSLEQKRTLRKDAA